MRLDINISQKGLLLVAVPLLFQVLFVTVLSILQQRAEQAAVDAAHSKSVVLKVDDLMRLNYETASAVLVFALSKSTTIGDRYEAFAAKITEELNELEHILFDDPKGLEYLQLLRGDEERNLSLGRQIIAIIKKGDYGSLTMPSLKNQLSESSRSFMQHGSELVELENRVLKSSPEAESKVRSLLKLCLFTGVGISVLISVALATFFSKNVTSRLNRLVVNTDLLKHGRPLPEVLRGRDEIAHVDLAFHEMAAALNEAFRKERAVMDNAMDVICSVDAGYRFTKVNPAATSTWGYEETELLGHALMEFIVSEDLKKVRPILDQLTTGRLSNAQVEARLSCKNGTEKWMLWSIQWSKLEDSFYCVVHDINESKKIEQLKQDFANMITHDLKTPLMSTQAFLDILTAGAYGPLSENGIINVRRAKGSLSRLVDLLTQLLEIEKLSSGHVELQFSKVSVRSIVDTAIAMVESLAHEQKVDFLIEGDENVVLIADKDRIVQVMQNLLSNAIKFSPPNGKIAVAWSCDQSVLQVQVMDQGPGVEKEYQDIIFEHFRQAPQPEKTKFRSSGLGLAICKAIVEEHKGSIGFLRNEGRGSTFWFRLPLDTTIQSPSAQVKTRADVV